MSVGAKEIGWRTGGSKGKIGGVALGDNAPVRHDVGVGAVEDLAVVRADELASRCQHQPTQHCSHPSAGETADVAARLVAEAGVDFRAAKLAFDVHGIRRSAEAKNGDQLLFGTPAHFSVQIVWQGGDRTEV